MKKFAKAVLTLLLTGAVLAGLVWAFLAAHREAGAEEDEDRPIETPSRVATQNGEAVLVLDAATQQRNAIRASALSSGSGREQLHAAAIVLSVQELIDLRTTYLADLAQVDRAQASLDVSRQDYERVNTLYQQDRNASQKMLQAAQGTMRNDQVTLSAVQNTESLAQTDVRQRWGPVVAGWLFAGSPEFERLISRNDVLIQVTVPGDSAGAAPPDVSLQTPRGVIVPARFISAYPKIDPRIQGPSFLYVASSHPELVPGMTLTALLSTGATVRGAVIPQDAVVWWQGKAWIYVQLAADRFARREIPTDLPVKDGWLVASVVEPGQKVVTGGAQQLLSEEFRSQIQVLEEGQ
jgi:hypothetical protein